LRKYLIAALIASCLAFPLLFFASSFWISNDQEGLILMAAYFIYLLGIPLTLLPKVLGLTPIMGNDGFIWMLIMNILFLIQWILWSQSLVFLYSRGSKGEDDKS
jgi:hypothetical protein